MDSEKVSKSYFIISTGPPFSLPQTQHHPLQPLLHSECTTLKILELTWSIISLLTTNPVSRPSADLFLLRRLHREHEIVLIPVEETLMVSVHLPPLSLTDGH